MPTAYTPRRPARSESVRLRGLQIHLNLWGEASLVRPERTPSDCYWFADYLGDLDALVDHLSPDAPIDLAGHSMGGNIVMGYAGVRPARIRRLVNMEGYGVPDAKPHQAPERLAQWLDELKKPQRMRGFDSLEGVAQQLVKTNPRLAPDKAAWLATQWARRGDDGRWHILGDPAHKIVNPASLRRCCGWKARARTSKAGTAAATRGRSSSSGWRPCRGCSG